MIRQYEFTASVEDFCSENSNRVDYYLAQKIPDYSRSFMQRLIEKQLVQVNNSPVKKSGHRIAPNDHVAVTIPNHHPFGVPRELTINYTALGVTIIHEEPDFLIISKPAGLITHTPQKGSPEITLVDWLLHYYADIKTVGDLDRPGIVHRLDKNTSGLLIIPKNPRAHMIFGNLFRDRHIHKTYHALVLGAPEPTGTIDLSIKRHPHERHKMTHSWPEDIFSRKACTHYHVLEYFKEYAYIEARPITGRTHQIRVHCAAINHPIMGDTVYGTKNPLIARHALHAHSISFEFDNRSYHFTAPLPDDFTQALQALRLSSSRIDPERT